jgi:hypothetical protein
MPLEKPACLLNRKSVVVHVGKKEKGSLREEKSLGLKAKKLSSMGLSKLM